MHTTIKSSYGLAVVCALFLLVLSIVNWADVQTTDMTDAIARNPVTYNYRHYQLAQAAAADVTDGLVAHYAFDEGTGNAVTDSGPNASNGLLNGGTSWVAGYVGSHALSFDGSSGYVSVPSISKPADFTFSAWINAASVGGGLEHHIVEMPGMQFYIGSNDKIGGGSFGRTSIAVGQWYFVAYTADSSGQKVYVNGVLDASVTTTVNLSASVAFIGRKHSGGGFFNGTVDDVRVYGRALTPAEISTLYAAGGGTVATVVVTPPPADSATTVVASPSPTSTAAATPTPPVTVPVIPRQTIYYVRASAAGSNNGTDWTNAWNSFDAINWSLIGPGNVICIAGGSYGQLKVQSSGALGNPIVIKRASTADPQCGAGTVGWNSGYDAQVLISGASSWGILLGSSPHLGSYVTVDGMTDSGIKITTDASAHLGAIQFYFGASYDTFRNIDMAGPAGPEGTTFLGGRSGVQAIAWSPSGPGGAWQYDVIDHMVVSHSKIHGSANLLYFVNVQNSVIEYSRLYDNVITNSAAVHNNVLISDGSNNIVFRYNDVSNWPAEGLTLGGSPQKYWYVYGNVFHDTSGSCCGRVLEPGDSVHGPIFFYNNTVVNVWVGNRSGNGAGSGWTPDSVGMNNIYWNIKGANTQLPTNDYDFTDIANSEAHGISKGSNPFVNYAGKDYRIVASVGPTFPKDKGISLGATYNQDINSNIRGSDGSWDIGAYEYCASYCVAGIPPADIASQSLVLVQTPSTSPTPTVVPTPTSSVTPTPTVTPTFTPTPPVPPVTPTPTASPRGPLVANNPAGLPAGGGSAGASRASAGNRSSAANPVRYSTNPGSSAPADLSQDTSGDLVLNPGQDLSIWQWLYELMVNAGVRIVNGVKKLVGR